MHRASTLLLCLLGLAATAPAADEPSRPALSARLAAEVRARLPSYDPAPPPPRPLADLPPDPDVVVMPRMEIRERRLPATDPDDWLTPDALRRKATTEYLASMNGLTAALNSWHIPLIGTPVGARAVASRRAEKLREEFGRLGGLADALRDANPAVSAELRDELTRAATGRPPAPRR